MIRFILSTAIFLTSTTLCLSAAIFTTTQHAWAQTQNEILVHLAPNEEWHASVIEEITGINNFLEPELRPTTRINILYDEGGEIEYRPSKSVILMDQIRPAILVHEYGHHILESYLIENSPGHRIWQLLVELNEKSLAEAIPKLEDQIKNLESARADFINSEAKPELIQHVGESIAKVKAQLRKAQDLIGVELKYLDYLGHEDIAFLLNAYHELFADTLSAIKLRQWEVITTELVQIHTERNQKPHLPEGVDEIEFMSQRSFQPNVSLAEYEFKKWELESLYTRFAPARSAIRLFVESGADASRVLTVLAKIITEDLEIYLTGKKIMSIEDIRGQNQFLIESLVANRKSLFASQEYLVSNSEVDSHPR